MNFNKTRLVKCLILISSIYIYGCSTITEMPHYIAINTIDFTKYTARGFQITPESYMGQYESIALFQAILYPRIFHANDTITYSYYDPKIPESDFWTIEHIRVSELIDSVYRYTSKLGANAIVNFKADVVTRANGDILYGCYQISGFAIKKLVKNPRSPDSTQ